MILSKIYPLLQHSNRNSRQILQNINRSSHTFYYRSSTPPDKSFVRAAEIVQGVAWWWVLWHLWTEPSHITGEFEYPDPRKWTDAELGIPSD